MKEGGTWGCKKVDMRGGGVWGEWQMNVNGVTVVYRRVYICVSD